MYTSKITGLGYYVPENVVTNDDLSKLMVGEAKEYKEIKGCCQQAGSKC